MLQNWQVSTAHRQRENALSKMVSAKVGYRQLRTTHKTGDRNLDLTFSDIVLGLGILF